MLIPEAREHQKRRYIWTGVVAGLTALVLAALIAGGVVLFSGSPAPSRSRPPAAAAAGLVSSARYVYFRPVLCAAPAYTPGSSAAGAMPPASATPSCSPASEFTASNLDVTPSAGSPDGFSSDSVAPDAALAAVPSTSHAADRASAMVLLPAKGGLGLYGAPRLVLGPAEMTNTAIGSARVHWDRTGQWVVDYTMAAGNAARLFRHPLPERDDWRRR